MKYALLAALALFLVLHVTRKSPLVDIKTGGRDVEAELDAFWDKWMHQQQVSGG